MAQRQHWVDAWVDAYTLPYATDPEPGRDRPQRIMGTLLAASLSEVPDRIP